MTGALSISLLFIISTCCMLLSFLPIISGWTEYLQLGGLAFFLMGTGALVYCMFKNC